MLTRTLTIAGLLVLVAFCLLELALHLQSSLFREYAAVFLSLQWMLLACFAFWCGTFLFLSFGWKDWPLIGLLLIALALYFLGTAERMGTAALVLLFGVTLGRGTKFFLCSSRREEAQTIKAESGRQKVEMNQSLLTSAATFLMGLVALLAFSAWWHLDIPGLYHGPRWMGLWNNPNIYGVLMGAGVVLSAGLLLADRRWELGSWKKVRSRKKDCRMNKSTWVLWNSALRDFLWVAVFMLGVGLVMSYSRGAWLGAAIGLLYLAWAYGKLKWRYVLPVTGIVVTVLLLHWGNTPDSAPWYVKRADLGRPSAQNRATAWRAGLEIMRDHPLGVGWNNAIKIYGKNTTRRKVARQL